MHDGLIKTALSLRHRAIPASLHAAELSPAIDWDEIPFRVQREPGPWPAAERALAGVISFGTSGTNVHLGEMLGRSGSTPANPPGQAMLLPPSARSPQALRDLAATCPDFLAEADRAGQDFESTCYTASACRTHFEHRTAVVARHRRQRSNWLLAARARPVPPGARPTTAKGKSSGGPRSAGLHSIAAHRRRPSRDLYQSGERVEVQP